MTCNPCASLSEENPTVQRPDNPPDYGTLSGNDRGSEEFGYVEFSGKDGRTCPTCNGTGRIAKDQEDELVALIPYNDRRLKPSRTKCYVILAVTVCLVASALVVFFLFPRSVSIKQDKILETTVSINKNTSSTTITLKTRFNVTNANFFSIDVSNIAVEAFLDKMLVGTSKLPKSHHFTVGSRQHDFPVNMTIVALFDDHNKMTYVTDFCLNEKRPVHNIVIILQTTQTVSYLQHSEQSSLKTYNYVDCGPKHWWDPT